jgi:hypothetical protein
LWTNEQRRRVLAGEMTATIRAWQAPQVKAGKRYRFDDDHELVVTAVELRERAALSDGDIEDAGFGSREGFEAALPRFANGRVEGPFYVVRFRLEAREEPPPAPAEDVERLLARLERLDTASEHGPWTGAALGVIARHPRVVSTKLARQVGRERFAFKADVRKLKRLGLTRSHEVGYEITELGRQVLDAMPGSPSRAKSGDGAGG